MPLGGFDRRGIGVPLGLLRRARGGIEHKHIQAPSSTTGHLVVAWAFLVALCRGASGGSRVHDVVAEASDRQYTL
jgi:hypothetical protein